MNNKRVIKLTEFIAHGSNVTACSIGRKCNRIAATGGEDKKVNLWTLNKPTCIMSLTGHTSSINSITFSSNEDKIVSGSNSGSLKVWDLEANKLISNLVGHKASVTYLEYHTYADYIASGSIDAQIRLWDLRRKGCIFTYKGHSNAINSLKFSPDSKWIASASDDCLVKIWDLKAGKLLTDLKGHTAAVNTLEFHPNEFLLATGSSDRTVKFWDLEKMENVSTSSSSSTPNFIKVILFEPNGRCLFSASQDYLQSLSWEPSKCYDSIYCQWKQIADMTISSNKLIAASTNQNTVSFYAVDLLQVQPIGQSNEIPEPHQMNLSNQNSQHNPSQSHSAFMNKSVSSSTRRNFHHQQQLEASEQPDENQALQQMQNEMTSAANLESSEANICNQEEYNKIFRPRNQITRANEQTPASGVKVDSILPSASSEPSIQTAKKIVGKQKSVTEKNDEKNNVAVDKSFFIDIKVAQPPTVLPTLPPITTSVSNDQINPSKNNLPNNLSTNNESEPNIINKLTPRMEKIHIKNLSPPNLVNQANNVENELKSQVESLQAVEEGHDSFIKALRNRHKNIQIVRNMWINGNIKSALDAAVNMDDSSLMVDILGQINQQPAVWNLDICTILLSSIKNLISSKYDEHMQIGSDSAKLILKNFGKLIKSNLNSQGAVGVDITREERQRKCNSCYSHFLDILSIIDKKCASGQLSQKLMNNFREINLLMKTIDN